MKIKLHEKIDEFIKKYLSFYRLVNLDNFAYIKNLSESEKDKIVESFQPINLDVDTILDGSDEDELRIERSAELLHVSVEAIKMCNDDELLKMARKFKFFAYLQEFEFKVDFYNNCKDGTPEDNLLYAIFGENSGCKRSTPKIDKVEVKTRLIETLKRIDASIPGTYHKNARIRNLNISTEYMFSYDKTTAMIEQLIFTLDYIKKQFIRALDEELTREEIDEYNFLVDCFSIIDTCYHKPLYYEMIKHYAEIYKKEYYENQSFVDIARIQFFYGFEPWKAVEFTKSKALVQKLAMYMPSLKEKLRVFAMNLGKYFCCFTWSDAKTMMPSEFEKIHEPYDESLVESGLNAEEYSKLSAVLDEIFGLKPTIFPTQIYVDKSPEELAEFEIPCKKLTSWARPVSLGGLELPHTIDDKEHFSRLQLRFENPYKGGRMHD